MTVDSYYAYDKYPLKSAALMHGKKAYGARFSSPASPSPNKAAKG